METAAISYRVADFLKKHTPFHAVGDADLLALAKGGRVRFNEPNEYILWQGEPHKPHVYVIQQGTVSLWDEAGQRVELRDVRGAGDMLGLERYNGARSCVYSARSESDVVIYGFAAEDFEACVLKYPHAAQYVAAEGRVTPDYQPASGPREPTRVFLHAVVGQKTLTACGSGETISRAAGHMLAGGTGAIAVTDSAGLVLGLVTQETIVGWVASGHADATRPIASLLGETPVVVAPGASVADSVLAMVSANADVLAITSDGTLSGTVEAIVTSRELASVFGDQPALLAREIPRAASIPALGLLMRRSRAMALQYLTGAASVEWLAPFVHLVDVAIVERLIALLGGDPSRACWCFCGSSGRGESLTALAPHLVVVVDDADDPTPTREALKRVLEGFVECGYLPRLDLPFEPDFYVAHAGEWKTRYRDWVRDPILQQTYRARSLFDLRPVLGERQLWRGVEATLVETVDRDFVQILANDCLASLPPLTFFEDAVVDSVGEHNSTFRLERNALRPIVDVGRVFGLAAKDAMGRSTLERLATARRLVPEHEAVFREAADTLRVVLWQQGRVGIGQGTSGSDLPPVLLSRTDRQVLKSGFRSILRLLELTADPTWLSHL